MRSGPPCPRTAAVTAAEPVRRPTTDRSLDPDAGHRLCPTPLSLRRGADTRALRPLHAQAPPTVPECAGRRRPRAAHDDYADAEQCDRALTPRSDAAVTKRVVQGVQDRPLHQLVCPARYPHSVPTAAAGNRHHVVRPRRTPEGLSAPKTMTPPDGPAPPAHHRLLQHSLPRTRALELAVPCPGRMPAPWRARSPGH
jgi:hypothetical protein